MDNAFVYYDMSVQNNSTTQSIPDQFSNTGSNQAVLAKANDYSVACIRFSLPSDCVPLLKQMSVAGSQGTFTNGSNVVTNVSNPFSGTAYVNMNTGLPAQSILNFAINMVICSTVRWPSKSFTEQPIITGITYDPTNPQVCSLTLAAAFGGTTGTYSFDASLFWVAVYNPATTTSVTHLILAPPAQVPGAMLYYDQFYEELPDTYEEIIAYWNEVLAYCYWEVTEVDGVTQADPSFFVLAEATNLIQYYESQASNFQTFVSHQMYNLLKGLPDREYAASSLTAAFPLTEAHQLLAFDVGFESGLNSVSLTPIGHKYTMSTTNGSPTVTFIDNNTVYPIFVGMAVTGTGIPALTTVTAVTAPTSITLSANATATNVGVVLTFTDPAYVAFRMTQAYTSLAFWTPLERIVLSTASIPVAQQILQPATPLSGGQSSTPNSNMFRPILTDFEPLQGPADYLPFQYFPQGPWRFTPLIGEAELRQADLQVFWTDFNGNFNQFLIPPAKTSSKQLVFVKNSVIAQTGMMSG